MNWHQIASTKRASILQAIPTEWRLPDEQVPPPSRLRDVTTFIYQHLSPLEFDITNSPAHVLLARLRSREYSAVEVTRAFCHRASLAHQLTNCLSEPLFPAALAHAASLDAHLSTTSRPLGPLHGLPVSLKDRFDLAGADSACGYVAWLNAPKTAQDEGALVRALRRAGAVLYVKTAVPTSMLMGETTNNIIGGSTLNPRNRLLSAGGASGGEGALLACRGSPVGWGSDIAGSVRIPAAFNGLFGLRPSYGRVPGDGLATSLPGLSVAQSVVGPMSGELEGVVGAMRWVLSEEGGLWREAFEVVDLPWREAVWGSTRARMCREGRADGTLVFAVMGCDGEVRLHPPVRRAIEEVARALRARGYEVIDWDPPPHAPAANLLFQIFGSTAGQTVRAAIDASGEPPIPQLREWYYQESGQQQQPASSTEFWHLCQIRDEYRAKYHRYWAESRMRTRSGRCVDGVTLPVAPSAAVEEGRFEYYAYSAIASVLDYTAGTFPVTMADCEIDVEDGDEYQPLSEADRRNWQSYRKELFNGAPVGLHVMGQRLQEEKVLAMMEAIVRAVREFDYDDRCL